MLPLGGGVGGMLPKHFFEMNAQKLNMGHSVGTSTHFKVPLKTLDQEKVI